ncbi:hypothetical protein IRR91_002676 [Salmonella enterica]|nr:hypothetical protein [Salmonella enterica]EAN8610399.1 hypothetical protein [Salmonella enterica subsp. arizonae serovar 48:z4,z24:-]ECJ2543688.1 hypothetical protein [Salmonella enterica subsp. arizonae]EDU1604114.1 hypothetical protein [Salmonella enterica subsp. houtenae serovar 48:g,z51:-]EAN1937338.1 hypothetical protein [Salmonella enterica]
MKVVAGFTESAIKATAIGVAIREAKAPSMVDDWSRWFEKQPCDHWNCQGDDKKKRCTGCTDNQQCKGK